MHQVKARIDGQFYALKRVKLSQTDHNHSRKMLREVTALARLVHPHIVRYIQAWVEEEEQDAFSSSSSSSEASSSSLPSYQVSSSSQHMNKYNVSWGEGSWGGGMNVYSSNVLEDSSSEEDSQQGGKDIWENESLIQKQVKGFVCIGW